MVPTWQGMMSSAVTGKDAMVQTKLPQKQKAVQVSGCRQCQRLALQLDNSRDNSCVKCEQADDLAHHGGSAKRGGGKVKKYQGP